MRRAWTKSWDFFWSGADVPWDRWGRGGGSVDQNPYPRRRTRSVFRKGVTVMDPYKNDLPSPTYHPDFSRGSNIVNNPNNTDEEPWMHEFERYLKIELGDINKMYTL
jgi:hypothetical protein